MQQDDVGYALLFCQVDVQVQLKVFSFFQIMTSTVPCISLFFSDIFITCPPL
ncbi:hypothetical protein EXN66_Car003151 [Channa argus]|uniref:Uncharacterized protein n=1 Tax=Channa argus TaxID=215402 RepID=A0A6G1PBA1_CHAAH|nr:hypothetical protein EXN66_Car003151 [Channa argus]